LKSVAGIFLKKKSKKRFPITSLRGGLSMFEQMTKKLDEHSSSLQRKKSYGDSTEKYYERRTKCQSIIPN
jgi:hypothetical protein